MAKKKRPLIERDVPPLTPADLAKKIEDWLREASRHEVVLESYTLNFEGGISHTWSKKNDTRS